MADLPEDDDTTRRERFTESVTRFLLKPRAGDEAGSAKPDDLTTVDEIEGAVRRADDKERLIGLLAAPVAALITILVTGSLVSNDPKAHLANGAVNPKHVDPSTYLRVALVCLVLSVLMLVFAWLRKRIALGVVTALYGLSVFNLHFWGFGIPFIVAAAWYLVRAYRLQQRLKAARADGGAVGGTPGRPSARASKRYTPPSSARGRS